MVVSVFMCGGHTWYCPSGMVHLDFLRQKSLAGQKLPEDAKLAN